MTDFITVQKWYAEKCDKTVDELDDYDNHICKVSHEYTTVINRFNKFENKLETPYLDEMINELDGYIGSSDNYLSKKANEKLAELKAIKKAIIVIQC